MNQPIVFLDFDGVLNTEQYQASLAVEGKPTKDTWGPLFDPPAVENLRRILDEFDAQIVISSSWRYVHSLDSLRSMWVARDLPGEILDALPCDANNISRGEEIECWLERNDHPDYVIIDDLDDFTPAQHYHYVEINPTVGITEADAQNAIEILRKSRADKRKLARIRNSEKAAYWRKVFQDMRAESIAKIHKRHAFLSDIVKEYTNLNDFVHEKSEFFEMMGVEVDRGEQCVSLYFQLDYNEYEEYFVIPINDGKLAVGNVILWQNEVCANEILNIFTGETYHDAEAIHTAAFSGVANDQGC